MPWNRKNGKQRRRIEVSLEPQPASAPEARAAVREWLGEATNGAVQAAELCIDELVSNVVDHAHTRCEVVVDIGSADVRVEVHDRSSDIPVPAHPDLDDVSGRGLLLVAAFSDRWGYEMDADGGGKTVWCEVSR